MYFTSSVRRDLGLVVAARSAGLLGDAMAVVALTLRLHDAGSGPWLVAALLAAGALPLVVAAPVAGSLVDRYDSRSLLVLCGTVQAALCLGLALVTSTAAVLGLVAALAAVEGVAAATWQALVPRIVGDAAVGHATSLLQAGGTLASVLGPAVTGVLVGLFGTTLPLLVDAGTYAVVALAALAVHTRRRPEHAEGTVRGGAWDGVRTIAHDRVLAPLVGGLAVFVLVGLMVNVVEVFLVRDSLAAGSGWYGALVASWAVGMVVGSLAAGRLAGELRQVRAWAVGSLVLSASIVGFGLVPSAGWLLVASVVGGTANGVLNVCVGTILMTRTPEALRGRVAAAATAVVSAASVLSLVAGGALAAALGPRAVCLLAGGLSLATALMVGPRVVRATASTSVPSPTAGSDADSPPGEVAIVTGE
jgi:MFS family permease